MRPWIPTLGSTSGWQAGPVQDAPALASLQAALERARGEYGLHRPDSALQILGEMIPALRRSVQRASRTDLAQQSVLLASARCLEGRVLARLGQPQASADAFSESISLFQGSLREGEGQTNIRAWTDYGIALFRADRPPEVVDRPPDAIGILEKVCASGNAPAEAFGYLGVAYRAHGNFSGAEEALRRGLQLTPGDEVLCSVLAQTLDQAGKPEAPDAYCEAAIAAGQVNDLETARRLLSRALEIAPTAARPLAMMIWVLRAQNDDQTAMDLLNRTLKCDGSHPWALALKALLLRDTGDLDGAILSFRKVEVQSAELSWVLVELAKALHETAPANDAEALDLLERAAQLNPQDPAVLLAEAEILETTDLEKAIAVLRKAVGIEPNAPELHAALAQVLFQAEDYRGASAAWEEVLRLDPKSVAALTAKAQVLQRLQQTEDALRMLRRAASLEPGNADVLGLTVDVLVASGRSDEALDELDREIQRDENSWAAHWKRGNLLVARKRFDDGLAALEKAAALQPGHSAVQADLGEALRQSGRYDEAGQAFDRAIELDPSSADALGFKAYWLCECAAFPEAAGLLERALGLADQAWLHSLLGWAWEHTGPANFAKAEAALRAAIERDPTCPWHRKHLANVLYDAGRQKEANALFEELITDQAHRQDELLLALLGWCQYRLRRYDEALRLMQSCVSLSPDDVSTQFDIALVLLASGRMNAAVGQYRLSIERAQSQHKLRRRGLFYIALYDLVNAARDQRIRTEGPMVFSLLREALAASGIDPAQLSWLPGGLPDAASTA